MTREHLACLHRNRGLLSQTRATIIVIARIAPMNRPRVGGVFSQVISRVSFRAGFQRPRKPYGCCFSLLQALAVSAVVLQAEIPESGMR
jgi:hypothetical protein